MSPDVIMCELSWVYTKEQNCYIILKFKIMAIFSKVVVTVHTPTSCVKTTVAPYLIILCNVKTSFFYQFSGCDIAFFFFLLKFNLYTILYFSFIFLCFQLLSFIFGKMLVTAFCLFQLGWQSFIKLTLYIPDIVLCGICGAGLVLFCVLYFHCF